MPPKAEKEYSQPRFYACYLLRPVNVGSFRTYVGSTPNPPRRIRQHNGEIKGGAVYTRKFKPWNMEMIIYGFPSKLAALQFEWGWIHPEKSRHLRHPLGTVTVHARKKIPLPTAVSKLALPPPLFPKNKNCNRPESKVAVVRKMVTREPWNRWPLHVRLFSTTAERDWERAGEKDGVGRLRKGMKVEKTFGGVDGKRVVGGREMGDGEPIEVDDYTFASKHYQTYLSYLTSLYPPTPLDNPCSLCPSSVDLASPLTYSFCPNCDSTTHLTCLSTHFLAHAKDKTFLLPTWGACPPRGCARESEWGEVVRGCWAVKRGLEGTLEALRTKGRGGGKRKAADEEVDEDEEESDEEEGGVGEEMLSPSASPPPAPRQRSLSTLLSTVGLKTPPKKQRTTSSSKTQRGSSHAQIPVETPPKAVARKPVAASQKGKPKTTTAKKIAPLVVYVDVDDEDEEDDSEVSEGVVFESLIKGIK